jgi:hypothetical protein
MGFGESLYSDAHLKGLELGAGYIDVGGMASVIKPEGMGQEVFAAGETF